MSCLGELSPAPGSRHAPKRLGRGRGSGLGQTSGKGHKGQLARSGGKVRRGFEGGQTPLSRRLPKFGFSNAEFRISYSIVNLDQLSEIKASGEITPDSLKAAGLVRHFPVKILGRGSLTAGLTIKAHAFSQSAKEAIEKAGGKIETLPPARSPAPAKVTKAAKAKKATAAAKI